MNIIIGTAGHIDHGKTSLVRSLTGVDADRLPEEKKRGITIDLGFAELSEGDDRIGFVDVPGHERFVKNMLAGASGIDAVVLVVAADEGVMPQTREHFDICRLLDTRHGIVVLTKSDLVESEFIELVEADVAELVKGSFLEGAPVLSASTKTDDGIDEVRKALFELASKVSARPAEASTRLHIDRTFSVKGFGAVITGTLASGEITNGSEMELMPGGGKVRVRGVQTYGNDVKTAFAGQRTAVNLGGIDHADVERGMVLAGPGSLSPTQIVDCEIEVLKDSARPIRSRQRVRVHFGTVEALARVEVLNEERQIAPGQKDLLQIRFEKPVTGIPGERLIIRQYSPQFTIAGGRILDAHARKRRRTELPLLRKRLLELAEPDTSWPRRVLIQLDPFGFHGCDLEKLRALTGLKKDSLIAAVEGAVEASLITEAFGVYLPKTAFEKLTAAVTERVARHHKEEPLSSGIARETLREQTASKAPPEVFRKVLLELEAAGKLSAKGDTVRSSSHSSELSSDEKAVRDNLLSLYEESGCQVPTLADALKQASASTPLDPGHARKIFQILVNGGEIVKVSEDYYFSRKAIERLINDVREYAGSAENRLIGVPEFKEVAGVSRKYAIPLLEYLDGEGITRRAGNQRIVL